MKKHLAALIAAAVVGVFAIPALAVANPFSDVPPTHWAHNAIGDLAARGVLFGFPDGTFRGSQSMTRFEMASVLARALASVDINKADRHSVEMLRRLVVEFSDELNAIGVTAAMLDDRIAVVENRLGGWALSGSLRMDVEAWRYHAEDKDAETILSMARLFFDRRFGENDDIRFHARFSNIEPSVMLERFFVEFPAWFDTTVTVGRFSWDWEEAYNFYTLGASDLGNWALLTDRVFLGYGLTRSFRLGNFQMYVQRPTTYMLNFGSVSALEAAAIARFQFTEQFGLDVGAQYFHGDDASIVRQEGNEQSRFNSLLTAFGGVRFDLNRYVSLRGIYYQQRFRGDYSDDGGATWYDGNFDNTIAYRILVDVNQDLLGFTSLWLGYDFIEGGFWTLSGDGFFGISERRPAVDFDMRTWRIGAIQDWNDQWRSWAYFAHHTFVDAADDGGNLTGSQLGLGVEYRLNHNVTFALNYVNSSFDGGVNSPGDNHLVRFRTMVNF